MAETIAIRVDGRRVEVRPGATVSAAPLGGGDLFHAALRNGRAPRAGLRDGRLLRVPGHGRRRRAPAGLPDALRRRHGGADRWTVIRRFDVLVVGAGPAGLAAATAASEGGRAVGLVDENAVPGGQIWRGETIAPTTATFVGRSRVFAQPEPGVLWYETPEGRVTLIYEQLILAPGARERLLPFPGWTLPNVTGAGGLQALVKSGLAVAGKSVVVAGSGQLLLAVAGFLRKKGAIVRLVAEQAPRARVIRFGLGLCAGRRARWCRRRR